AARPPRAFAGRRTPCHCRNPGPPACGRAPAACTPKTREGPREHRTLPCPVVRLAAPQRCLPPPGGYCRRLTPGTCGLRRVRGDAPDSSQDWLACLRRWRAGRWAEDARIADRGLLLQRVLRRALQARL